MNPELFVDEIKRLAADSPDTTTEPLYLENDQPCCIMAHALINLKLSDIEELKDWRSATVNRVLIDKGFTSAALIKYARKVQEIADDGKPWSVAVAEAEPILTSHGL
jgi:hypothetical protein